MAKKKKKVQKKVNKPDLGYIIERNLLIPIAEKYANDEHGIGHLPDESREEWGEKWNLAFHSKMNELAVEKGLVSKK